jgi:hypothetical protein
VLLLKRQTRWQINKESSQLLCAKNTNGKEQSGAVNLTKIRKGMAYQSEFWLPVNKGMDRPRFALKRALKTRKEDQGLSPGGSLV